MTATMASKPRTLPLSPLRYAVSTTPATRRINTGLELLRATKQRPNRDTSSRSTPSTERNPWQIQGVGEAARQNAAGGELRGCQRTLLQAPSAIEYRGLPGGREGCLHDGLVRCDADA
jgi:hypothetical protein